MRENPYFSEEPIYSTSKATKRNSEYVVPLHVLYLYWKMLRTGWYFSLNSLKSQTLRITTGSGSKYKHLVQ